MEYMESRMQDQIEGAQLAHEDAMQAGNDAAFPVVWPDEKGVQFYGITVRDYFAAKALAALIGHEGKDYCNRGAQAVPTLAKWAYEYADAMLEARAK